MRNPKERLGAAADGARRAKKSTARLLVMGFGYSLAYFLDPEHGPARRRQALDLIDRIQRRRRGHDDDTRSAAETRDDRIAPSATNGIRLPADLERVASI